MSDKKQKDTQRGRDIPYSHAPVIPRSIKDAAGNLASAGKHSRSINLSPLSFEKQK